MSQTSHTSFAVDDVAPATERIWSEPLAEHLRARLCRPVLAAAESERIVVGTLGKNLIARCHPLIDAVHTAFSRHYPLTLRPDDVWMVIAQGFSHHINDAPEKFRDRLVRHSGKRTLTQESKGLAETDWQKAISGFSRQIREASDPVLHETLICDFSTTTDVVRTASEVVLMDAYSNYFEYRMGCVCGIPRVTMLGTAEDWRRLRAKFEVLATFDLEWWARRLRPILDQLVLSADGRPSLEFWRAIYKPKEAYAIYAATGWIADLFPYIGDAPDRRRNHVFKHRREDWAIVETPRERSELPRFFNGEASKGVNVSNFPSGLCSVPVTVSLPGGVQKAVDLVAGFFGVEQDAADLALSPVLGWCVAEKAPVKIR